MEPAGYQTNYMRKIILFLQVILCGLAAQGQSLKKPDVPEPTLKMVKAPKYRANSAGSMGLFDWNFSLGYINKTATVKQTGTLPLDVESSGQYAMFHLQESILSNYFLAKKYKRNKRFKIGFQNTFDFGMKRTGVAVGNRLLGTAQAQPTIAAIGDARFAQIALRLKEWQPHAIVIGVPYPPDGAAHENTVRAQKFGRQLRGRFGLPVFEVDERYSTTEALASGAKDADAASAGIILEQFLRNLP